MATENSTGTRNVLPRTNIKQTQMATESSTGTRNVLPRTNVKQTQMAAENSTRTRNVCTSNLSHSSRKLLQCIHVITRDAGHAVRVIF